ncbi:MAG: ANTAR domain-containing protein [Clostridium sp.]|nr:ANTAR domain-containing protein [Clostridium sp.]MCM1400271.1 ANTAR domain-containing protein [Clostridium sp.]MCM1460984.1 ANTAR domain-containing protein [Bacteroides sp.]
MSAILIVLPKLEEAKKIQKILNNHGYPEVFSYNTAAQALQAAQDMEMGVVISAYKLSDMFYLDLKDNLPKGFELILIGSVSAVTNAGSGVLSLVTPIRVGDLVSTVDMVLGQLERQQKKKKKPVKKRTEQEDNYIRNAKYLLMDRNHLSEEEAFRYIQKCSMDNSTNMVETAQMILTLMYQGDV